MSSSAGTDASPRHNALEAIHAQTAKTAPETGPGGRNAQDALPARTLLLADRRCRRTAQAAGAGLAGQVDHPRHLSTRGLSEAVGARREPRLERTIRRSRLADVQQPFPGPLRLQLCLCRAPRRSARGIA